MSWSGGRRGKRSSVVFAVSPVPGTAFTATIGGTFNGICGDTNYTETYYHNGSGTIPAAGELVYSDANGVNPLANDYYHTNASGTSTFFRITNNTGFVALLEPCVTP